MGEAAKAEDASFNSFFEWFQDGATDNYWPPQFASTADSRSYRRSMYLNSNDDLWYGVCLSSKTSEFSHHIHRDGDRVIVKAKPVGDDPPVEINFFCLRRDSWKGIYSHSMGSYPFSLFQSELWRAYKYFVVQKKQEAKLDPEREIDGDTLNDMYTMKGKRDLSALYRPEDFERIAQSLSSFGELRFTTYDIDAPSDRPFQSDIRNVHHNFRFKPGTQPNPNLIGWMKDKISKSVVKLKNGTDKTSGSLLGMDGAGKEITVYFESNLDEYMLFDDEDIASLDIDTTNLAANPCVDRMIKVAMSKKSFQA